MALFAITLGAPGFLWAGLGLATAPIIIHLLHRQRYRVMDWAAMKWLLEAVKKNYRRVRLEQWLLLAIRTLLLLLVSLAMAQPALEKAAVFLSASPVAHSVLVFDNSLSMHYTTANQSRWERAKALAHAILDSSPKGDLASVVLMGSPPSVLVGDPSPYLDAVGAEIDGIKPQDGVAELEPALDQVAQILKNDRAARKRVFILTDMQRRTWVGDGGTANSLGQKLRTLREQAETIVIDTAGPESPNLAVVDLAQAGPVAVLGRPTILRATLANFSSNAPFEGPVELLVDGQVDATERVSLPSGEQRTVNFAVTFRDPGERSVQVRLPEDGLRTDNRRWLTAQVRESLSVLLIDGEPSGEPFRSETSYLNVALNPGREEGATAFLRTTVRLEAELLETRLEEYDLVALCNVGQLTDGEAAALRAYLRRGGGLLIVCGSRLNSAAYNLSLFRPDDPVLPVKLGAPVGDERPGEKFFTFDPLGYQHPIVEPFRGAEQAGLLTTKIFRYTKVEARPEGSARTALAYTNGDPAVIIGSYGRGPVALVTTSVDLDWTTWPISPSFVPVMQELARVLSAGRVLVPSIQVGEPILLPLPREGFQVSAKIAPPGENVEPITVRLEDRGGIAHLVYANTDQSGVYLAEFGPPIDQKRVIAVNTVPAESDLTKLVADDLRDLFPGWDFTLTDRWEQSAISSIGDLESTGAFHRPLLYLALLLLFLETVLAWRFGHHH
jgi:hypothetical protein